MSGESSGAPASVGAGLLRIRIPDPEDAPPRLARLSAQLGYPTPAPALARRLDQLLARSDHCLRVACPGGAGADREEPIGWIHAHERVILEAEPWCEIAGLVVHAAHRGRGAGRMLVAAVEDRARGRGLRTLKVGSSVVRAESHPFYRRPGFAQVKTQHVYLKTLG